MPARTTRQRPQQFLAVPSSGGILKSRHAETDIGLANYLTKFNFRRDLDKETRREGCEYFVPQPDTDGATEKAQSFPTDEPITLIHNLRRPDGTVGLIVGTEKTLFRHRPKILGEYVDDGYWQAGYAEEPDDGYWKIIGDGFADRSAGAKRWVAANVNGWALITNGLNPPVMYRLEWDEVRTIPDLLFQNVGTVNCLTEFNSMAILGNVGETSNEETRRIFETIKTDAAIGQEGYFFGLDRDPDVYVSGVGANMVAVPVPGGNPGETVDKSVDGKFKLTATANIFKSEDDDRIVRTTDRRFFRIETFENAAVVLVQEIDIDSKVFGNHDVVDGENFGGVAFWVTNFFDEDPVKRNAKLDLNSYIAGKNSGGKDAFPGTDADWVGRIIGFSDGSVRTIVSRLNENRVFVNTDRPVRGVYVAALSNPEWKDYARIPSVSDQRHYRLIWSNLARPDSYGKTVEVLASAGSPVFNSKYDLSELYEVGEQVVIQGAGPSGGIMVSTVVRVGPGLLVVDEPAVQSGDAVVFDAPLNDSITGYEDLQDQGSGILAVKALLDRLVIYKDASIFVAVYTGEVERPLLFKRLAVFHGHTLHYRHTLLTVGNRYHVYAAREGFFRFDLADNRPVMIGVADDMQNVFFRRIHERDREDVFAVDNNVTEELWIVDATTPPSDRTLLTLHPTICYDYRYDTFSTTDLNPTAMSTIISPETPKPLGETEHLFLLGYATGALHVYGKTRTNYAKFDKSFEVEGSYRIYYRRRVDDYDVSTREKYLSELESGLDNFLWPMFEKRLGRYDLSIAPIAADAVSVKVELSFRFARSLRDSQERKVGPVTIDNVFDRQMVPLHHQAYRVGDIVRIDGVDNPCALVARSFDYNIVESRNALRTL